MALKKMIARSDEAWATVFGAALHANNIEESIQSEVIALLAPVLHNETKKR
jgi:hypothetical protein